MEGVALLAPVRPDHHPHRQRRPVLERAQRAQVVGDALGQHRHHAVGEIHRIAAHQRFAVERRARAHIPGDIGDGDGDEIAAGILRVLVRCRVHGVVVVLGVGRIDGDERQSAPVLAAGQRRRPGGVRLGKRLAAEHMRNGVGVDGDQAHRLLGRERTEPLLHLGGGQPIGVVADDLHRHEVAFLGAVREIRRDDELATHILFVDRDEAPAAGFSTLCPVLAEDAEDLGSSLLDQLQHPAGVADMAVGFGDLFGLE
jgi:hypothetical protein